MQPQYFQDICRQFHLMPNLKQLPPTFFIAPEMYTTGLGLPPILRLDIIFEAISLAFSLVITVIGLYAWRRIGSKTLLLLSLGFLTMSAAMLLRIVLISWAFSFMPEQGRGLRILPFLVLGVQELVYSVVRLAGYIIFLYLYSAYPIKDTSATTAILPISLIYNPVFEAVSATILGFIVYQLAAASRTKTAHRSGLVLAGFTLLLISHLLFLLTPVTLFFYFAAHLSQLVSLTAFLAAVSLVLWSGERL
jgi:uncharacterized membrane protein